MDKRTAAPERLGYLSDGLALGTQRGEPASIKNDSFTAHTEAFGATVGNACLNSLTD